MHIPSKLLAGIVLLVLLPAGFTYSGVATLRQYRDLFDEPATAGPSATIDAYLAPVQLSSGEELRRAVQRIWPSDEHVVLLADASALSRQDIQQIYFATAYLLYPRTVSLAPWCDPHATRCGMSGLEASPEAAISGDVKRVIVVAHANVFPDARSRRLSEMLTLVQLR